MLHVINQYLFFFFFLLRIGIATDYGEVQHATSLELQSHVNLSKI
jgi:hypothetical protein